MKRYLIIGAAFLAMSSALAQEKEIAKVLENRYGQKLSPDGITVVGQLSDGSAFTYNRETDATYTYQECMPGNGNCFSNTGLLVGSDMNTMTALIMQNGRKTKPALLSRYIMSDFYGITPDASRICGIVFNPDLGNNPDIMDPSFNAQMYLPIYCDLTEDGTVENVNFLPVPKTDFFGTSPQYCTAVWISEDGKTISGQVVDSSGLHIYPIIYRQDADGEWSYSLPSESLYNPNKLPAPKFPVFEYSYPDALEYIPDPKMQAEYLADLEAYIESGYDPDMNPNDNLWLYTSPEEEEAYKEAVADYHEYDTYYNNYLLPQYYEALDKILEESVFFQQNGMAMDPTGTWFANSEDRFIYKDGVPTELFNPYMFNLKEGTYKRLADETESLTPIQVLADGTLIACTPNPSLYRADSTPIHSYILLPGKTEYMTIEDYLQSANPIYAAWMNENLFHEVPVSSDANGQIEYKSMTVTGLVAVSPDMSVIMGGVDGYSYDFTTSAMYFTYILSGEETLTSVKEIDQDYEMTLSISKDGCIATGEGVETIRIFDLSGREIMVVDHPQATITTNLSSGLYIITAKTTDGKLVSKKVRF